jgi:cell division protein FtsQ
MWRRVRRWLLGVLIVALVCGAVWLIWFSTVLVAKDVEVEGMTTLHADAISEQADVPMGVQLARLDTVALETRVARMERIDKVDVRRRWPNTVLISVKERVPVGWVVSEGAIRYVDRHGIDFRTVPREPENLLEIRIETVDPLTRQQALEAVTRVVTFLRSEARDLYAQINYVSADTQDSVHLRLTEKRTVVWGSAEDNEEKAVVLRPLLKVDAERYDVSAPELPTTKGSDNED